MTVTYSSEVLADSPLAWYRQDDTSGTTMTDSSGNSHNGAYTGTYSLNAASLLTADSNPSVDYTSAKGTVTGAAWMNASSFSVEALIRADTIPGGAGYAFIVSRDLNGTAGPWWLAIKGGKVSFLCVTGGGITEFIGTATLSTATTYHIVCTYDGANMRIYLNGSQDASTAKTGTPNTNTQDLVIGNWNAASLPFDGKIDEVALYGTALSSGRVSAHYTAATANPNATVTVPVATATAAGAAPVVSAGSSVAPPAAAASASAASPAVTGTGDATVLAPAASVIASGLAPSVAADATVVSVGASASADALPPTVVATVSATVVAPVATSSAAAIAPFVSNDSPNATIQAPAAHATAAARMPGLGVGLDTDVSNVFNGRERNGFATVVLTVPVAPVPAGTSRGPRVDKAVPLPLPTLVNGRPT